MCQQMESRRVELVTRTSAFIHYVILLHKYIELPILYTPINIFVFFIVNLKSSTLKMFIPKLCHRDKRGHRIAQIAAFAIKTSKISGGGPPDPYSGAASLRSAAATVPATSTSFLIFREVDLPLYAISYLAPLKVDVTG